MRTAVKITEKAKNSTFDWCKIYWWLENSWKDTYFKKTSIWLKDFTDNHPILYGTISAIIWWVFTLIIEYLFFK